MKVALIDDEAPMRDNMKSLLARHAPEAIILGEAGGVKEGVQLLSRLQIDLLFLDVEMKDGTGFDVLSQLDTMDFGIIFVTGHDRYAIKAFKYSAIDYLLKPVDPLEMKQAIQKAKNLNSTEQQKSIENLIGNNERRTGDRKIILKDATSVYLISIKEIVRCQADNNYTVFFLEDGKTIMVSTTLKEYERLFDDQNFFRAHQSHLINLDHFRKFDRKEGGIVVMKDGTQVPVSSRKKEQLIAALGRL
ncbi:MAG: LytTR family DNA-binding domain-containing protein [Bacteroidota bacterium]